MSQPIKNREAFFGYLEKGLQAYFDHHDSFFGGIIHLTVGVREGQVGGIIKSEEALHYSGFTLDRVREILKYVLPKYVPRSEVALITDAIIEELRMGCEEPESPQEAKPKRKGGRPKKQNPKHSRFVPTPTRYESVGCDDENFSSPKESKACLNSYSECSQSSTTKLLTLNSKL